MQASIEQFLESVAKRGSWIGGGSVTALSAALSAALLEKLLYHPLRVRQMRGIRRACLRLIQRDADTFARVIRATRARNRSVFARSLKTATEVQVQVCEAAQTVQAACRTAQRSINPKLQSDLRCAMALALAAADGAKTLVRTNLAWLNDRPYAQQIERRLRA